MEKGQFGQAQEVKEGIVDTLTKQEKDAAKLLVKNLDIDFDCKNFENPSIQKFFSGLQALALNEEEPEEVEDLLEPNLEELNRFETIMDRFRGTFFDG
jgi:ATP-dependent DNA helicase 2 subunit 1